MFGCYWDECSLLNERNRIKGQSRQIAKNHNFIVRMPKKNKQIFKTLKHIGKISMIFVACLKVKIDNIYIFKYQAACVFKYRNLANDGFKIQDLAFYCKYIDLYIYIWQIIGLVCFSRKHIPRTKFLTNMGIDMYPLDFIRMDTYMKSQGFTCRHRE